MISYSENVHTHNSLASIVKGIAIILMVIGHTSPTPVLERWIYLFHLPCFFFVSGYLFKEKYLNAPTRLFVKQKIKGLYQVFVKWALIFLLLHNVFASLHFYTHYYSLSEFTTQLIQILVMKTDENLIGGFWFFKELFLGSLLFYIIRKLGNRYFEANRLQYGIAVTLVLVAIAFSYSILPFKVPLLGSVAFLATAYFGVGYLYNKIRYSWYNSILLIGITLLITLLSAIYLPQMGVALVKGTDIALYFFISLSGILFIFGVAQQLLYYQSSASIPNGVQSILRAISHFLDYAGKNSLYVLLFHITSFKLVHLVVIWLYNKPLTELADCPVISVDSTYLWVVYSMVGVGVPLAIMKCYDFLLLKWKGSQE